MKYILTVLCIFFCQTASAYPYRIYTAPEGKHRLKLMSAILKLDQLSEFQCIVMRM